MNRPSLYDSHHVAFPAFFLVVIGLSAIPRAIEGELAMAILYAVVVLISIGHLIFTPVTRPKKMARSLEASRRVAGFAESGECGLGPKCEASFDEVAERRGSEVPSNA